MDTYEAQSLQVNTKLYLDSDIELVFKSFNTNVQSVECTWKIDEKIYTGSIPISLVFEDKDDSEFLGKIF